MLEVFRCNKDTDRQMDRQTDAQCVSEQEMAISIQHYVPDLVQYNPPSLWTTATNDKSFL